MRQVDEIVNLIVETVMCKNDKILIASNWYPASLVKKKFLMLTYSHIEYVLHLSLIHISIKICFILSLPFLFADSITGKCPRIVTRTNIFFILQLFSVYCNFIKERTAVATMLMWVSWISSIRIKRANVFASSWRLLCGESRKPDDPRNGRHLKFYLRSGNRLWTQLKSLNPSVRDIFPTVLFSPG